MEDTKYYTPEIEEFHFGFEFEEEFKNPNWNKLCKPAIDVWEYIKLKLDTSHSISRIIGKIKINKVRVKYLDKEDIESLLIKHNIDIDIINDNGTYLEYNLNGLNSIWFDINNPCKLFIKQINANNSYRNDVLLNIKNKNELDKLLKQLQIL